MFQLEPRATHGPMDLDEPELNTRLAQFAVPDLDEGPSRKRPHHDLSSPIWSGTNTTNGLRFDPDSTPFMFHASRLPQTPEKPWTSITPRIEAYNLGMGSSVRHEAATGAEDVEMLESPERAVLDERSTNLPPDERLSSSAQNGIGDIKHDAIAIKDGTSHRGVENERLESRPVALGGIKRELKRREQRRGEQRNQEPLRSEHVHHYNFHPPAAGLHHTELPMLILRYVQAFVNTLAIVIVFVLFVQLLLVMLGDVRGRIREASTEILQEIAECHSLYSLNRCDPALRVPAMEAPCKAWQACTQRDPHNVQRVSLLAETFASVFNAFVGPLSFKTIVFILSVLWILVVVTNSSYANLRSLGSSQETRGQIYASDPVQASNWQFGADPRAIGGPSGEREPTDGRQMRRRHRWRPW